MAELGNHVWTIQSGIRVSRDQGALANLQRSGFCAALQYRADPDASDRCRARRPKLYESLDFLEKQLDEKSKWLVRRYRRELRWDRRTYQEQEELREILRATTRGIQFACVKLIVRRLNELAVHFRENKPSIDNLRLQLAVVRRPVPL